MAPRKGPAPKTMQTVMKRKKREEEEGEEEKEEEGEKQFSIETTKKLAIGNASSIDLQYLNLL